MGEEIPPVKHLHKNIMKKFIFLALIVASFSIAAKLDITSVTSNAGGFEITNTVNKISYGGIKQNLIIVPSSPIYLTGLTSTNSSLYALTGIWYNVDSEVLLEGETPFVGIKEVYENMVLYVSSTGTSAVVKYIWY